MRSGLTIGDFAAVTRLSVRTLRRYHEAGLLEPDTVDPSTGYRYYTADQIPTAQVIYQLRQLDVPLAEVESILAAGDPKQRAEVIAGHLQRLEAELDRTQAAVASLRRLLRPDPDEFGIELRTAPARTVVAIKDDVQLDDSLEWYDTAMAELDAAFPAAERTGPPGGHYANELFTVGTGTMAVYRPVREPHASGRIVGRHSRAGGGRTDSRDLHGGPARHPRPDELAYRDRLAGVPPRPVLVWEISTTREAFARTDVDQGVLHGRDHIVECVTAENQSAGRPVLGHRRNHCACASHRVAGLHTVLVDEGLAHLLQHG